MNIFRIETLKASHDVTFIYIYYLIIRFQFPFSTYPISCINTYEHLNLTFFALYVIWVY